MIGRVAWFVMWRCGGTFLADTHDECPFRCPEHPAADRLAPPEHCGVVAPGIPRGLAHDDPESLP